MMTNKIKTIDGEKVKYTKINDDPAFLGQLEGFETEDGQAAAYKVAIDGSLIFVVLDVTTSEELDHLTDVMTPRINMEAQSPNRV
jgi:hypothetical protein